MPSASSWQGSLWVIDCWMGWCPSPITGRDSLGWRDYSITKARLTIKNIRLQCVRIIPTFPGMFANFSLCWLSNPAPIRVFHSELVNKAEGLQALLGPFLCPRVSSILKAPSPWCRISMLAILVKFLSPPESKPLEFRPLSLLPLNPTICHEWTRRSCSEKRKRRKKKGGEGREGK